MEARNEVRQVCDWLLRPSTQTMEACVPAVDRAIAHLRELCACVPPANTKSELISALTSLADEVHSARTLLAAAGSLYWGRMRRLTPSDPEGSCRPEPSEPVSVTG
jgi:hypothetical protein